jgi:hypothetical protein
MQGWFPKIDAALDSLSYVLHTVSRKLLGIAYVNRLNNAKQPVPVEIRNRLRRCFARFSISLKISH